jgi:dTDP-4-dehydrorhamnose reductase
MIIGVIGANGFVGKNLIQFLKKKHKIIKILKKTNFIKLKNKIDIIIHTANSSKKFESRLNPERDYKESVKLTKKIVTHFNHKKIILISTISARNEKNIYGKNRKISEDLVLKNNINNIIFRLSVLFNPESKRGILYDLILNNKIYLHQNTLINPITIQEVSKYISKNLNTKQKIHEIGSYNTLSLNVLKNKLGSTSKFSNKNIKLLTKKNIKIKFSTKKILKQLIEYKKNTQV